MLENKKEDKNKCVKVNIFVKCENGSWKKENDETCVEVNIYAECDKKKDRNCDEY